MVGRFETAKAEFAGFGKCAETLLSLPFLDSGERVKKLLAVAAGVISNVSAISYATGFSLFAALPLDRRLTRNSFAQFFEKRTGLKD